MILSYNLFFFFFLDRYDRFRKQITIWATIAHLNYNLPIQIPKAWSLLAIGPRMLGHILNLKPKCIQYKREKKKKKLPKGIFNEYKSINPIWNLKPKPSSAKPYKPPKSPHSHSLYLWRKWPWIPCSAEPLLQYSLWPSEPPSDPRDPSTAWSPPPRRSNSATRWPRKASPHFCVSPPLQPFRKQAMTRALFGSSSPRSTAPRRTTSNTWVFFTVFSSFP